MDRSSTFDVENHPVLERLCSATCAHWNQLNYRRQEEYFDEAGDVWDANYKDLYEEYKPVVGGSTAQQLRRKNDQAWHGFFRVLDKYHDPDDDSVIEKPEPPGYWGNRDDGYKEHWSVFIEADAYDVEWGERSRLEILVGSEIKDEYDIGYHDKFRLEIYGDPKWNGEQGQLQITYDQVREQFMAIQSLTVTDGDDVDTCIPSTVSGTEEAAVDIGANNLAAITTTTGRQYLYEGRGLFNEFREKTEEIAEHQETLPGEQTWSKKAARLYRQKYDQRDHAQDGLVRDLVERFAVDGVSTVYVGKLKGVLSTHWTAEVNEKTHLFWAFDQFITRLKCVCEEYGITVVEESEALTTQTCPRCGKSDTTNRHQDLLHCPECGFEGHSDLSASENFLAEQTGKQIVRPMARPVRLKWDKHRWRADQSSPPTIGTMTNEERQTRYSLDGEEVAEGDSQQSGSRRGIRVL